MEFVTDTNSRAHADEEIYNDDFSVKYAIIEAIGIAIYVLLFGYLYISCTRYFYIKWTMNDSPHSIKRVAKLLFILLYSAVLLHLLFVLAFPYAFGYICYISYTNDEETNHPITYMKAYIAKFWDWNFSRNECTICHNGFYHDREFIESNASQEQPVCSTRKKAPPTCFRVFCSYCRCCGPVLQPDPHDLDTCITPCGHFYHRSCIQASLKHTKSCPVCRSALNIKKCYFAHVSKKNLKKMTSHHEETLHTVSASVQQPTVVTVV